MDEEFIIKEGKSFIIRREINGLLIEFGSFSSLANAIAFKEELEEDGWPYRKEQIINGQEKEEVKEYGQYLTGKGKKFVVSREIAGVNVVFGVFDTLKNAKKFKYTLSENAWSVRFSSNLPKYGKFIIKQGSRFVIKRDINGQEKRFGSYGTLDEAIVARDKLITDNWGMDESSILSNLGVELLKGKDKHIGKAGKLYTVVRWDESEYSFYGFYRTLRRAHKALDKFYNSSWSGEDSEPKSSKNITKSNHTYRVSNWIEGHLEYFGHYNTFDEAIKARDLLIENDWNYNYLIEENLIENPQIHRYIYKTSEGFKVIKKKNDEFIEFGCFKELGEALDFRNKMIVNKWKESSDEDKIVETQYDTYIFLRNGKYYLKNDIDGVTRIFGVFNDPLDAVALRVECIKYDWGFDSVPEEEYFENPSDYAYLFKSIASENGLIEEDYTNISFPVKVRRAFKENVLKIKNEHVEEFIPVFDGKEQCTFYVEGTDVKGKLLLSPKLHFCENEEFFKYLRKLYFIDPKTTIRVNMVLDKGKYELNDLDGKKLEFKVPFSEKFIGGKIDIPREVSKEIVSTLPYEEHCAFSVGDYDLVGKMELDFKLRFNDNSVILFLESFKDYDEFLDIVLEF